MTDPKDAIASLTQDLTVARATISRMSATRLHNMYNLAMGALAKAEQERDEARRSAEAAVIARCRAPYTDEYGEHSCEPPECRATQPSTDAVERAREIVEAFPSYTFDRQHTEVLVKEVATALTAARREGRALDEEVVEAARKMVLLNWFVGAQVDQANEIRRALAARDAAINPHKEGS